MTNDLTTLRQAGFFKDYAQLTNAELIAVLQEKRKEEYSALFGYEYEPEEYSHLTELLAQDTKKFLDIDLESDVCAGNTAYVRVLEAFAGASGGHFKPVNIEEVWQSDNGPIEVSFLLNEQQIIFEPEYMDDWLDGRIFGVINQEMQKVCEETFAVCTGPDEDWFGQNIIHIRLTRYEMQLLKDKLKWVFPDE